jgi:protein-S-isoprenylcysteine O-methyltransferase Ste14
VVLGLALRAWAGGSAGGHTRTRSIEAPRLATAGPYAYVRNPIYLGSIVLGIGMVGLLGDPWMLLLCAAAFTFLYVSIIPAEERFLRGEFGAEYERYCAEVPRLLPRFIPWNGATPAEFNWHAARGEAHIALILIAIYVLLRGAAWLTTR